MNKPESRAAMVRQAEKVLLALLRTPKTRSGLIAAVAGESISKRFVFGWLSEHSRNGVVVVLKSTTTVSYQLATHQIIERPALGVYPTWLEPRELPDVSARQAYLDGKVVVAPPPTTSAPKKRKKKHAPNH